MSEQVALLPRDTSEPMPKQIENDLAGFRQQTLQEDLKRKRERALAAFQTPWLLEMETTQAHQDPRGVRHESGEKDVYGGLSRGLAR